MTFKRPRIITRSATLVAGGALIIGAAVATVATVANAQQPTPSPAPQASPPPASQQRQQAITDYLNRLAQNLGIASDRLRAALQQTAVQEVDAALGRGEITAQQAQQARDRINAGEFHFGPGFGRGGPGGHGGRGGDFFASHDQLAQFLGITTQQLQTELNGRSLAQVAQTHGRTRQQLVDFLVTTAQQRLTAEVQAGRLTQQEATQRQADLRTRIEQKVDEVRQLGQRRGPGSTP